MVVPPLFLSGRILLQRHYADFLCFWNLLMKFWLSALTWPVILSQITVLEFVNEILQSGKPFVWSIRR